jgi:hypothetical protein
MDLKKVVDDVADVLQRIGDEGECFRNFQPGVGPYGEPQVVKLAAVALSKMSGYEAGVKTARTPDLLILGQWAREIKLARPFGDNGRLA